MSSQYVDEPDGPGDDMDEQGGFDADIFGETESSDFDRPAVYDDPPGRFSRVTGVLTGLLKRAVKSDQQSPEPVKTGPSAAVRLAQSAGERWRGLGEMTSDTLDKWAHWAPLVNLALAAAVVQLLLIIGLPARRDLLIGAGLGVVMSLVLLGLARKAHTWHFEKSGTGSSLGAVMLLLIAAAVVIGVRVERPAYFPAMAGVFVLFGTFAGMVHHAHEEEIRKEIELAADKRANDRQIAVMQELGRLAGITETAASAAKASAEQASGVVDRLNKFVPQLQGAAEKLNETGQQMHAVLNSLKIKRQDQRNEFQELVDQEAAKFTPQWTADASRRLEETHQAAISQAIQETEHRKDGQHQQVVSQIHEEHATQLGEKDRRIAELEAQLAQANRPPMTDPVNTGPGQESLVGQVITRSGAERRVSCILATRRSAARHPYITSIVALSNLPYE